MNLKIKKLHPGAVVPTYATDGSACFDLYSVNNIDMDPNTSKTAYTGLAFEVPKDHVMLVFSRSGHGFKHGVRLGNCVGVIDSDYRGEVAVRLQNDGRHPFYLFSGDRIAQAMVIPVLQVRFEEVDELSDTERGVGGFGSTGN